MKRFSCLSFTLVVCLRFLLHTQLPEADLRLNCMVNNKLLVRAISNFVVGSGEKGRSCNTSVQDQSSLPSIM